MKRAGWMVAWRLNETCCLNGCPFHPSQGECDGLKEDVAQAYAANFKAFVAAARADLAVHNPR